jgi:hypothetical protein
MSAQSPASGLWGGFSLGIGWQSEGETSLGPGGAARLAYRLSSGRISLGVEANAAAFIEGIMEDADGLVTATATAWFHSRPQFGGMFLKAGLGFAVDVLTEAKGIGWMGGIGTDILLGQRSALTPSLTAHGSTEGGRVALQLALGLNFR